MQIRRLAEQAALVVIGDGHQSGSYVLGICVPEPVDVAFGRFEAGRRIHVPAGVYAYVGSAMAHHGPSSLARRLVRHATRTGDLPPHRIRNWMLTHFPTVGLGDGDLLPRADKRRHWHVDHLLDLPQAEITRCIVVRCPVRLEGKVAQLLEAAKQTSELAPGLGANDAVGATHLLRADADSRWWDGLPSKLVALSGHPLTCSR